MAHPLKKPLKNQYNGTLVPKFIFSSPAARWKGLRLGASPEPATLAVTIIPVSPAVGVGTPGRARFLREQKVDVAADGR